MYCKAQCNDSKQFRNKIITIENSPEDGEKKLSALILLKKQYESCGLKKDSVYAKLLHKIGVLQFYPENNLSEAISNTLEAVKINTSGSADACLRFAANSYLNLGFYYQNVFQYNEALVCFDSSIIINNHFVLNNPDILSARLQKGNIYYKKGNYQKDVEETSLGLTLAQRIKDSVSFILLLLERAQSLIMQQQYNTALTDVNKSIFLLKNLKTTDNNSWANALRYKADIIAQQRNCSEAFTLFMQCINYRKKVDAAQTAIDYNDAGFLLLNMCKNQPLAKKYFDTAYKMGLQLGYKNACALAKYNLGEIQFSKSNYQEALEENRQSLQFLLSDYKLNGISDNPPYKTFLSISSKSVAETIMSDRSKYLLYLYKQTNNVQYLKACINTALINDKLITGLRHEQTGEQSKLYWRNDTRNFFTNTLEACYLDKNATLAFYFMEKSRAVLLNDKLNELGAAVHLPAKESAIEETLRENITIQQQKLLLLDYSTDKYRLQLNKILLAKEDFEHYIKSLEQKYPAYYQYKYADDVPSLKELQQYLAKNNQSFIHYFLGDTVTYILAITSNSTRFIRLSQKNFNKEQLSQFLQLCENKEALMNHYDNFAEISNSIYNKVFQPLQVPKGRVVICSDNIIIPFDALCIDKKGKNFLVSNFSFSYVYSAQYLLKHFNNATAAGNFLGFAPVSFASYLNVQDLKNAADALQASSEMYHDNKLFTYKNATRNNFFKYTCAYSIVNIFSHARADTTNNEPVLYMHDSMIYLSELQLLNNPATKLVLLSACQTNVGKAATGEGIYSLARGFATAGISSVAATLWKADEQTIYSISEKFNQYLSEGMTKDEALQKAKLYFIQNNTGSDKLLPYYWANMILIGNTDAIRFAVKKNNYWWWIAAGVIMILLTVLLISAYNKRSKN